jgi:hypothetical protein
VRARGVWGGGNGCGGGATWLMLCAGLQFLLDHTCGVWPDPHVPTWMSWSHGQRCSSSCDKPHRLAQQVGFSSTQKPSTPLPPPPATHPLPHTPHHTPCHTHPYHQHPLPPPPPPPHTPHHRRRCAPRMPRPLPPPGATRRRWPQHSAQPTRRQRRWLPRRRRSPR